MDEKGNWTQVSEDEMSPARKTFTPPIMYLSIGQIVEIEGEKFKVKKIGPTDITLRSIRCSR